MKKSFLETTWSKVEAGDTVLVAHGDEISQVTVKEACTKPLTAGGLKMVFVHYAFRYAQYHVTFKPDGTVYVQSRL